MTSWREFLRRYLWDLKITYDEKDKWFLVGLFYGFLLSVLVIGFVQGWLPPS